MNQQKRADRIARCLDDFKSKSKISTWVCYAPDGVRRWVLYDIHGLMSSRAYSTREIECFLQGAGYYL
jgi:hypothetical protein